MNNESTAIAEAVCTANLESAGNIAEKFGARVAMFASIAGMCEAVGTLLATMKDDADRETALETAISLMRLRAEKSVEAAVAMEEASLAIMRAKGLL